MGFRIVETLEEALPLSEAGLLWYKRTDGAIQSEADWQQDKPGWWCDPWKAQESEWDRLVTLSYVHAVLLED